jgi:uncharacterized protein (TIGR02246 family)
MPAEDQITQLLARYERALNESDAELAAACYTADGVFLPPGLPTISCGELADGYARIFAALRLQLTFAVDELVVASETAAHALTRSTGTKTMRASGTEGRYSARELFVFRCDESEWKIARSMFNTLD